MKKIYSRLLVLAVSVLLIMSVISASMPLSVENKLKEPLDKITFIHYKDGTMKAFGGNSKSPTCYKLMGVKWLNLPVSYVINPKNDDGLSENFVTTAISTSAETWDDKTSRELFNDAYDIDTTAVYGVQNYKNAIVFGNYPQAGVIGVTSVWYTRYGKQIVEFDMILDTDFTWGDATVNPALMDLQNIVTHELGHAIGLSDLYTQSCKAVTMYGYSRGGDIEKRTLEQADITGLRMMYGL